MYKDFNGPASLAQRPSSLALSMGHLVALLFVLGFILSDQLRAGESIQVGYGTVRTDSDRPTAVASALFSLRNSSGILISEAGVGAVGLIHRGRIFVDQRGNLTGLALANPGPEALLVGLSLRDSGGSEIATGMLDLPAGQHRAVFVGQLFPDLSLPPDFLGSLTFTVPQAGPGLAALSIRQGVNALGEAIFATLPVVELTDSPAPAAGNPLAHRVRAGETPGIVLPHIGVGGIISTQIVMINPGNSRLRGQIHLFGQDGHALLAVLEGEEASSFEYDLPANGVFRATLTRMAGVAQGYATVSLSEGDSLPAATAIFQFRNTEGDLLSEAGTGAPQATSRGRLFVDSDGTQTGVALAAADSSEPIEVTLRLLQANGREIAVLQQQVAGRGHFARFVDDLFALPEGFRGILEVESPTPIYLISLKLTTNSRAHPILTTLPIADLDHPPGLDVLFFPQIGFGGGFDTQFIFLNSDLVSAFSGSLSFFTSTGTPLEIPERGNRVDYFLVAGGAGLLSESSPSEVGDILIGDRVAGAEEITLNQGNSSRLELTTLDTRGSVRGDFRVELTSLDEKVATVSEDGLVEGLQSGFSTLTLASGGLLRQAVIAVTEVGFGGLAFNIDGITRGSAGQIFLADAERDSVYLLPEVGGTPEVYAGIPGMTGLLDGPRLASLFARPAGLVLDQADGQMWLADRDNHTIRKIPILETAAVTSVAGSGQAGSADGIGGAASFRNPQSVDLDTTGNLWIADTGNHTIRRLNLVTLEVATVAGQAGLPGFADGLGSAARFDTPTSLTVELETLSQRLERERVGDPPPIPRVLVADSNNNAIRRVFADGRVETVSAGEGALLPEGVGPESPFESPQGVAVGPAGNIFVSQQSGEVVSLLTNGQLTSVVEAGTFDTASQLALTRAGRLLVANQPGGASELRFGAPEIDSVVPDQVALGSLQEITLEGSNFTPEVAVFVEGLEAQVQFINTGDVRFQLPPQTGGVRTITVQTRGGIDQAPIRILPPGVDDLAVGEVTTLIGTTSYTGDGGPASAASLSFPLDVEVDSKGNILVADYVNARVRMIDARTDTVFTIAGTGVAEVGGDGGPAVAAMVDFPRAVRQGPNGDYFFKDSNVPGFVRKISAESGLISTVAGADCDPFSDPNCTLGDGGPALEASLSFTFRSGLAIDSRGILFISDSGNDRVRTIDPQTALISTVIGCDPFEDPNCLPDPGRPGTQTSFQQTGALALDSEENLFVAEPLGGRVWYWDRQTGLMSVVAGSGCSPSFDFGCEYGEGGPALDAGLDLVESIAVDANGNLLIAESIGNRVRRVDFQTGSISTVAGCIEEVATCVDGEDVLGLGSPLGLPNGVTTDGSSRILIADTLGNRVRILDDRTGLVSTVMGCDIFADPACPFGDGVPAIFSSLPFPTGFVANANSYWVADYDNRRVRQVDWASQMIETVAGTGCWPSLDTNCERGDGGPALAAGLSTPEALALDDAGNLYIGDEEGTIRRLDSTSGFIDQVADGFYFLHDLAIAADQGLLIVAPGSDGVFYLDPESLSISIIAEVPCESESCTGSLLGPGIDVGPSGDIWFADSKNNKIKRIDFETGQVTVIAGANCVALPCELGDGGPGMQATFAQPGDVAYDPVLNKLYIADTGNQRIRELDLESGLIETLAGCDPSLDSACADRDGAPAREVPLTDPHLLTVTANRLLVVTTETRVRAIRLANALE